MHITPRSYTAEAAVTGRLFVKFGSADTYAVKAAANTDGIIGVSGPLGGEAAGRMDVIHLGLAEITLGGTVARGEFLTSDANGKAVKLTDAMLESGACHSGGIALASGVSGDYIPMLVWPQKVSKFDAVTSSAAELNILDGALLDVNELNILNGVTANKDELNLLDDQMGTPTFVIGAEGSNIINVGIQLTKAAGTDLAARGSLNAYLSDDANGDSIVSSAPDGGVAIGTDGLAIPVVAGKAFQLTSESDGDIDLNITHAAGAKTVYLICVLPSGKLVASTAITFA